jgi:hypothetical protein
MEAHSVCVVCNSSASSKCSACGIARYCSIEHQRKDWIRHKPDCLQLRRFTRSDFELETSGHAAMEFEMAKLGADKIRSLPTRKCGCKGMIPLSIPLQELLVHTEHCSRCLPTTDSELLMFTRAMGVALLTAPKSARANCAGSALVRFLIRKAMMSRIPTATAELIVRIPVMFCTQSSAAAFSTAGVFPLCIRVLDSDASATITGARNASLFVLWQLGPITEQFDLIALGMLPRIVRAASSGDKHDVHQARTILKDLMVSVSLTFVTRDTLRAQFASRPRFSSAAKAVADNGGLDLFCAALTEHSESMVPYSPRGSISAREAGEEADSVVIAALAALATCGEPGFLERIQEAVVAAAGLSSRAAQLKFMLDWP